MHQVNIHPTNYIDLLCMCFGKKLGRTLWQLTIEPIHLSPNQYYFKDSDGSNRWDKVGRKNFYLYHDNEIVLKELRYEELIFIWNASRDRDIDFTELQQDNYKKNAIRCGLIAKFDIEYGRLASLVKKII